MRAFLSAGLLASVMLFSASAQVYRQNDPYYNGRPAYRENRPDVLQMVENDLRNAAVHSSFSNKEARRYDNALRHLSEFQARLSRGSFDRGSLDRAIDDLNNVVRHNPLDYREREMLIGDLNRLREFRATRGGYSGGRPGYDPYGYRR